MYQQINLYQPIFRQQRKVLSAVTLLQVLAIAGIVLFAVLLYTQWTNRGLAATVTVLTGQHHQLEVRLGILEGSTDGAGPGNEIERLRQTINDRRELLDGLTHLTLGESHPFGIFLEILARRTIPGLWLTGISLHEDGETEISGLASDPMLVPRYLQILPDTPRFADLQSGTVRLARSSTGKPDIEFTLRSERREAM